MTTTPPTPAAPVIMLAQRVLRVHRRTLTQLAADHADSRLHRAVATGIAALDQVDTALLADDPTRAGHIVAAQTRLLNGMSSDDGWEITALAWALYALERIDRALRGVQDDHHLGLPLGPAPPPTTQEVFDDDATRSFGGNR